MPTYGFIEKFSGKGEEFDTYLERLQFYFTANDLGDITPTDNNAAQVLARQEKRKSILLSVIGSDTYSLLRTLISPTRPAEKTFDEITTVLLEHFSPKPSAIVCRYKFYLRNRLPTESVAEYMSELRKLAENCDFKDYLTDMLRDRLVCGIADERIQRVLLTEKELTLEKAYQLCIAEEAASKDTSVLKGEQMNKITSKAKRWSKSKSSKSPKDKKERLCYRCGSDSHLANKCKHKDTECHFCKKVGHLAKMCLKKKKSIEVNCVEEFEEKSEEISDTPITIATIEECTIYNTQNIQPPITVPVTLDNETVNFQIDTGAGVSIMNEAQFTKACGKKSLQPAHLKLTSYSGDNIQVLGKAEVNVKLGDQHEILPLIVVKGSGVPLLGRQWLTCLKLPWSEIFSSSVNEIQNEEFESLILDLEYAELFQDKTGKMNNDTAKFDVRVNVQPVFCKARTVPFAMKKRIQDELDKLENDGIIRKVTNSDWAAPLVPVIKPSGKLRLCGDYKLTANKVINLDTYPLPLIDELFASLSGGVSFTKLDLSQAYHQLPLDSDSRKFTTVNTPSGLYEYLRLPYGINSAVGIFQRTIENILKGLQGVCVYLDDILVTGKTSAEHLQNLQAVLRRLQENGITLKKEKCEFFLPAVEYLGFRVTKEGLKPTEAKVRAIKEACAPKNISELRSFIGTVNYYARFLPNLAQKMTPLYALLKKSKKWKWTTKEQNAFEEIRNAISEKTLLVHYDPEAELVLTCDASPFGIGAVLQQRVKNGTVLPIAFTSRTLNNAEKNYSQIEREGLSIIFGTEKFSSLSTGSKLYIEN